MSFLAEGWTAGAGPDVALTTPSRAGHHHFCFANASVAQSVLRAVGGFDEGYREYGNEDLDYGWRLLQAGVPVAFAPEAVAWQHYAKGFRTWVGEWRSVGRADVALWRRYPKVEPELAFASLGARHPFARSRGSM